MLPHLPDDLFLLVLARCDLYSLRGVCCSHRIDRAEAFWHALAGARGIHIQNTSRSLRSRANLRHTLFKAIAARAARWAIQADQAVWDLWMQLHKADAPAAIRRTFERMPDLPVDHRLTFYHGSTLLHLGARRGRLRSVRFLLEFGSFLDTKDDGGFTPLCFAAWSGRLPVVRELLFHGADITAVGTPPQSSSCGGRSPMAADVWAERKGFDEIARVIRAARSSSPSRSLSQGLSDRGKARGEGAKGAAG